VAEEEKKVLTKEEKAEARAKAKEEKAKAREKARAEKEKAKADKAAAKEAAKEAKRQEKEARAAAKKGGSPEEDDENASPRAKAVKKRDTEAEGDSDSVPTLLVVYIVVVAFALSGVGAYYLVKDVLLPRVHHSRIEKQLDAIRQERAQKNKIGIVQGLKDFTVNTYGSSRRFVVVEIAVEAENQDIIDEVLNREGRFRDSMIAYFRGYSATEIASPDFPGKAKQEIKRIINNSLTVGWIDSVYFTQLIVD